MNPQYAPPQSFGAPPQGFQQNRASPSLGPPTQAGQGFQNVPLGPPMTKPGHPQSFHPMNNAPPQGPPGPGQFPPQNLAGPPRAQIPSSQLPPGPPNGSPRFEAVPNGQPDFKPPQNGPPQFMNGPPPTVQNGPPAFQNGVGRPPQPGSQPQSGQIPPPTGLGKPPGSLGGPPGSLGGPPGSLGGPPGSLGGPPGSLGGPPGSLGGPPGSLGGPPGSLGGPPGSLGAPHGSLGAPPGSIGAPPGPLGAPPGANSAPGMSPQLQSQFGQGFPSQNQPPRQIQPGQNFNQPPLPNAQSQPQIPGSFPMNTQPPMSGQGFNPPPPGPNQFSQPPGPPGPMGGGNRMPPTQFNQPPMPGQPPLPQNPQNQYPPNPNQLTNQMQGMNLSGPRQYPGGPVKNTMNGDTGPHMPPPINQQQQQQQYMNGQQIRPSAGPGYPPMPGQPPAPGGPHAPHANYPQPAYQQPQQQASRLDPNQMPSPIQVCQDDQKNRSGVFCTNQKGLVPPLVNTNFVVQDQGNASPRFIRSTMYNVPISQDIMKQTAVPFSLVISPMAKTVDQEYPPPIVDFGALGPVRCIRCKAYMCPFMQFIDSGRRFQCLFCKATTDVPNEYFQHLDHTGQRLDRYERPELLLGTYEFVATTDYCRNNILPKPPAFIFVLDVSYNNIKSGLVHLLCAQMKDIIQNLPVDQGQERSNMRVGFITYNSSVHFYNIKGTLAAPQMLVVGDTQEMFMPLLDGFLCTPEESGQVIDALMQQIPAMFGDTRETETILLPAILAGLEALKASDCTGKLLVFHSTLPTAEAPGKLKNRDDRKLLGTDKEKTVLTPQTQAYNQLGQDCVAAGCSVDLFIFNNAYVDIATIGQVSRLTGGEIYKYTYFQADIDGHRLINDIITDISKPIAFDSIMRVRTSTGIRPTDFYGHFYMSNTTDMELASIDCDKAVGVEIKHDDKLSEEEGVYIQAALLYTSCSGQRRLRVINLSLKTCSQMADLYRSCDCDTIINYMAKQAAYKLLDNNPKAVKDNLVTRTAQILATYRKNCATPSSAGQLILPECMKLLPLYVNCMIKSDALSGGSDMTVDDRSFVMQCVMIMDIPTSVNYFYPRLIPLSDVDISQEPVEIPEPIRCTADKLNDQDVFILENGIHLFMWVGMRVGGDIQEQLFGGGAATQNLHELPELDNPFSIAVRAIIDKIREQRYRCMKFTLVRQGDKLEPVFRHFLAEDRGNDGSPSYVDFLIHMHKEIRTLLS